MFDFLSSKWAHVALVAIAAAAPAAAAAAGFDSSWLNAIFTVFAGGVGAHAATQYAKGK